MSFKSNLGGIRAWGRELVLPVEKIKDLIRDEIKTNEVDGVIDFGAGTLYWSKWFAEQLGKDNVYPVDIIYKDSVPDTSMRCYTSIKDIPFSNENETMMFFACDVLHHLPEEEWLKIEKVVFEKCKRVVLKDINCHYKLKNWMNRMHDRIINGERIRDIDPEMLIRELQKYGYRCKNFDMHKLWYPHFMIVAVREEK